MTGQSIPFALPRARSVVVERSLPTESRSDRLGRSLAPERGSHNVSARGPRRVETKKGTD